MRTQVGLQHDRTRGKPWRVYWYGDADPETGRQRKYTQSFEHAREARDFQAEKQTELNRGAPRDPAPDMTLGQLLDEFEAARVGNLSQSSIDRYGCTIAELREHFGDGCPIGQVDKRRAETFIASRARKDGKPGKLASWTLKQHVKHCRAIFGAAVEWGYIDRNPFQVTRSRTSTPLRVHAKSRPWHHITPAEFRAFIAKVPTARQRAVYWLMYGCGLRPGEAYNMTIDRVDLQGRGVHVKNRPATDDVPPFTVKADGQSAEIMERTVPIPEAAIDDLTEAVKAAFRSGGFIALSPARFETVKANWQLCRAGKGWGKHGLRQWTNRDMLNNAVRNTQLYLKKAEIKEAPQVTLTTFRKSYAQNLADSGTPPKTLAMLLGHTDPKTTMDFYNRVSDANVKQAAAATNALLGAMAKAAPTATAS